jgi:type IV pilus assembly protein PilF
MEIAQLRHNSGDTAAARAMYSRYLTTREFMGIPHTPRSLWIGIQIEREFQNSEILEGFERVLTTLYQDSQEYQLYRSLVDDN